MFLNLPIIEYDDDAEDFVGSEETIDINPIHISIIERDRKNKNRCFMTMQYDETFLVRLSRKQLKEKITEWMKDNLLSKIYKEIRDQTN